MDVREVDPFVGCEPTDLDPHRPGRDVVVAETADREHPPRRHVAVRHGVGVCGVRWLSDGYGRYDRSTEGPPARLHDDAVASGVTHFHHSGTGAIRKYYNYLRVTPLIDPLDELGTQWRLLDEAAEPGRYSATLDNGIGMDVTVGPRSAVHRYTFPVATTARIVIDCSHGGIDVDQGTTVPLRADVRTIDRVSAAGTVVMEGVPVSFHAECDQAEWRSMPWYDRRLMHGGSQLHFDSIRPTTLRPFGVVWMGRVDAGETVELRVGFSFRGADQAAVNLDRDLEAAGVDVVAVRHTSFDHHAAAAGEAWADHLARIRVDGGTEAQREVFATALYRSLIKPCFADGESPFWDSDGPSSSTWRRCGTSTARTCRS